jgi:hypothetical protein
MKQLEVEFTPYSKLTLACKNSIRLVWLMFLWLLLVEIIFCFICDENTLAAYTYTFARWVLILGAIISYAVHLIAFFILFIANAGALTMSQKAGFILLDILFAGIIYVMIYLPYFSIVATAG